MPTTDRSYRALLRVPTLGRVLLSMQIARVAQSMVGVALVLFTLDRYGSPAFAGFVTFASVFPGLLISPIAGALLDRHGRIRLVLLDDLVALAAMAVVGVLALADLLPGPLLLGIAVIASLTSILSHVGLRSLFPILVPEPLWERVNAVDSNGYVVATIVGPPIAATMVALLGGPIALLIIGIAFGVAAAILVGVPEPSSPTASTGRVFADAWAGLRYTWRNSTLRGLGFAITLGNLAHGMTSIVIPLIVIGRFGLSEAVVVVEAPDRSGALLTADAAIGYGRELFAVPGPMDAATSRGTNRLIADHVATLVTSPAALLHLIGLQRGQFPVSVRSLSEAEGLVLAAVLKRSGSIEELVPRVKLATSLLAATLTMLEARGLVTAYSGATFHATLEARRSGWGTLPAPPVPIEVGA